MRPVNKTDIRIQHEARTMNAPEPTVTQAPADELAVLLSALTALRRGDASVRLPAHWTGLSGKVADAFNAVVELNAGMADGIVTMPELQAMPSLRTGLASFFHETVHPVPEDPAFVKLDVLTANGKLTDGSRFVFQAAFTTERGAWKFHSVRVEFK